MEILRTDMGLALAENGRVRVTGTIEEGMAVVGVHDHFGRLGAVIRIEPDGDPAITFHNADGQMTVTLTMTALGVPMLICNGPDGLPAFSVQPVSQELIVAASAAAKG